MTSNVLKDRLGQCVGTYYLFLQLGRIIGPVLGLAIVQAEFQGSLARKLFGAPKKREVCFQELLFRYPWLGTVF
jgi:hypothetical protein